MTQWVEMGRRIAVELEDGELLTIGDRYRLGTDPKWGGIPQLLQVRADAAMVAGPAADAYQQWTRGRGTPGTVVAGLADGRPREMLGRLRRIWYDSLLGGQARLERFEHKFRSPGPALMRCPDGLRIERRGWRGSVDRNGIRG